MDKIILTGVRGFGRHGLLPDERVRGQEFVVDVELSLPLKKAGKSDDLKHSIDYAQVAQTVLAQIEGEPVDLIETLAERIANALLVKPVREVSVTVHKPSAPIPVEFADVAVKITRKAKP